MSEFITIRQEPAVQLAGLIDAYWQVINGSESEVVFAVLPDGFIDIVLKDDEIFLVGAMEVAAIKVIKPQEKYLGIRFKPAAMSALLGLDVSQFNDKMISLQPIYPELYNKLSQMPFDYGHLDDMFGVLFENVSIDERIVKATDEIVARDGDISMDELSHLVALSKKQLERLFIYHVGLSPKKYARTVRFFHTHKHLSKQGLDNLCIKVIEKGYYNQAHFNREYKAFTGMTPTSDTMSLFYNTKL